MTGRRAPLHKALSLAQDHHICHLYSSRQDLVDVLVPFYREGLLNGECCVWATADPLPADEARAELAKVLPGVDRHIDEGQLAIFPAEDFYSLKVSPIQRYHELLRRVLTALSKGYPGFRASGNLGKVSDEDWMDIHQYEAHINSSMKHFTISIICSYPTAVYSAEQIRQIRSTHQSTLLRCGGGWEYLVAHPGRN